MTRNYPDYVEYVDMESLVRYMRMVNMDSSYLMTDGQYAHQRKKIQSGLRPTYGEHIIIDEYGFYGRFSVSAKTISSFIDYPLKSLNFAQEQLSLEDNIYNENILSVMHENPEDLEFGGYNPLCDTAVYYFIEDCFEFDDYPNYAVIKESQELVPTDYLDEDSDEDYDVLDADGLDFWLFCAKIGVKLKPIDCLMED